MTQGRKPRSDASSHEQPLSVLLDTNILLDVILARSPWDQEAVWLLDAAARGQVKAYMAAHAVTTIHYLVEKARGKRKALTAISDLLSVLNVVPLDSSDFQRALSLELSDFEDAVQVSAALRAGAGYLVTRNARDFEGATIAIVDASQMLALIRVTELPR